MNNIMETKLQQKKRELKDEQDTLNKLITQKDRLDYLITRQQEKIWEKENEVADEQDD